MVRFMDNNKKGLKGGGVRRRRTTSGSSGNNNSSSFWAVDPTVPQLEAKVAELESELAQWKQRYADGNPAVTTEQPETPRTPVASAHQNARTARRKSVLVSGADPGEDLEKGDEGLRAETTGNRQFCSVESSREPATVQEANAQRQVAQQLEDMADDHKRALELLSRNHSQEKQAMQQEVSDLNALLQAEREAHQSASKMASELEEQLEEKNNLYAKLLREHGVLDEVSNAKDKTMEQLTKTLGEKEQTNAELQRSFSVVQNHIVALLMECCVVPASYFVKDAKEIPSANQLCTPVQDMIRTLQAEAFRLEGNENRRTRSHLGEDLYKGLELRQQEAMAYFEKEIVSLTRERDACKETSAGNDIIVDKLKTDSKEVKKALTSLLDRWALFMERSTSEPNQPLAIMKRQFEKSSALLSATVVPTNMAQIIQDLSQVFTEEDDLPLSWLKNGLETTKKTRKSSLSMSSKQRVKKLSPANGKRRRSSRVKLFPVSDLERLEPVSKTQSLSPRGRKRLRKSKTTASLSYAGRALQLLNHHEQPVLSINSDDDESTN